MASKVYVVRGFWVEEDGLDYFMEKLGEFELAMTVAGVLSDMGPMLCIRDRETIEALYKLLNTLRKAIKAAEG